MSSVHQPLLSLAIIFLTSELLRMFVQVFERGVKAISLSIDLWLHYVGFAIAQSRTNPGNEADHKVQAYVLSIHR